MRLQNKVAVVTGAGRGIGKGIAGVLASAGAAVVLWDVNQADLDQAQSELSAQGATVHAARVDIAAREEVASAVAAAAGRFGGIDILVNNAGIVRDKMAKNMTDAMWDAVLAVNLKGVFICCQEVGRKMMDAAGGKIVNVSSVAYRGSLGQANYAAAKSGIIGLSRTLALEWARYGITVNCVAPGMIDTDMTRGMPKEVFEGAVAKIPLGRAGTPADVGKVVLFLASEDSDYVTGQVINVCGGNTLGAAR